MLDKPDRLELSLLHGANIAQVVCPTCALCVGRKALGLVHKWTCAKCRMYVIDNEAITRDCPSCGASEWDLTEIDAASTGTVCMPQPCVCCKAAPVLLAKNFKRQEGIIGVMTIVDKNDDMIGLIPFLPGKQRLTPRQEDAFNAPLILQHNMVLRGRKRDPDFEILAILFAGMDDVFIRVKRKPDGSAVLSKVRGHHDGNVNTETV